LPDEPPDLGDVGGHVLDDSGEDSDLPYLLEVVGFLVRRRAMGILIVAMVIFVCLT
jgi:hypothetical protein